MIFRSGQFRKLVGIATLCLVAASAIADPNAEDILAAARVNPLGQQIALKAQLRDAAKTTPFTIRVDGAVRYGFSQPEQEIVLELTDDGSRLTERLGSRAAEVRPARFDERVRGSTITYEDLALKFLYWKNPKLLGSETIRARHAWKIEVQAPRAGQSQYGVARLWIDKDSGALLRMEGFNMQGRLVRRFEVISAQKLDTQWMLKQMRVEAFDPETKKVSSRTYLEVLGKVENPPAEGIGASSR